MRSITFARTDQGVVASFAVQNPNGALRTGLVAGDFTATVVNPADTATSVPTVAESAQKAGTYRFTIPSSFFTTHGVGLYHVTAQVDTSGVSGAPIIRDAAHGILKVTQEDVDTLADGGAGSFDRANDTLEDIRDNQATAAGVAAAVWGTAVPGAFGGGTAGFILGTNLDATVSSRASQASVDAIQNVTRAAITIPAILIPDAGTEDYDIFLNLFDTAGNPEDPDENSIRTPATNAADAITATDRISVFNGAFTAADLNRTIRVTGSGAGNNGDYIIVNVVSGTDVDVVNGDGTDPGFTSEGTGFATAIIEFVTVTAQTQAGVSRNSKLFSVVLRRIALGRFKTTYTADSADVIEQLNWAFTYTENAVTFTHDRSMTTRKTIEDNFTAADRTTLNNVKTDTTNIEADTQDIQSRLPAALVGGRMDSSVGAVQAGAITAAGFAAGAIDANALDTTAVNEVRDSILADSTPFNGANVDASISSRASQVTADQIKRSQVAGEFTVAAGSSSTEVRTNATNPDNFFDNAVLIVVGAAGVGTRRISEYKNLNGAFFLDEALPFTPVATDVAVVLARHLAVAGSIG